ncbi:MAG: lysostaphin resistance A-like protein [Candidatus Dormibacteria bacterium]
MRSGSTGRRAAALLLPVPGRGRPGRPVPWDWTDVALFFALFLTGLVVVDGILEAPPLVSFGSALLGGASAQEKTAAGSLFLETVFYLLGIVVILGLVLIRRRARVGDLGWRMPRLGWIALAVPAAAAAYLLITGIGDLTQMLFPAAQNGQVPEVQGEYGHFVGLAIPAVSVVAPIVEETFFRGFVYGWMRRHLNVPAAAILSGCFFALVHFQPVIFVPLAVLGAGLALLYEYSGSLLPGMIVHGLFNLVEILQIL